MSTDATFNSVITGYWSGSYPSGRLNATSFSTDLTSLLIAALLVRRSNAYGVRGTSKGYVAAGYLGAVRIASVDKLLFASDAKTVLSSNLSVARADLAEGVQSTS